MGRIVHSLVTILSESVSRANRRARHQVLVRRTVQYHLTAYFNE